MLNHSTTTEIRG